jgi:hypothetical protein
VGHVAVGEKHKVTGSNGIRRLKNLTWGMVHVAPPPVGPPLPVTETARTRPRTQQEPRKPPLWCDSLVTARPTAAWLAEINRFKHP